MSVFAGGARRAADERRKWVVPPSSCLTGASLVDAGGPERAFGRTARGRGQMGGRQGAAASGSGDYSFLRHLRARAGWARTTAAEGPKSARQDCPFFVLATVCEASDARWTWRPGWITKLGARCWGCGLGRALAPPAGLVCRRCLPRSLALPAGRSLRARARTRAPPCVRARRSREARADENRAMCISGVRTRRRKGARGRTGGSRRARLRTARARGGRARASRPRRWRWPTSGRPVGPGCNDTPGAGPRRGRESGRRQAGSSTYPRAHARTYTSHDDDSWHRCSWGREDSRRAGHTRQRSPVRNCCAASGQLCRTRPAAWLGPAQRGDCRPPVWVRPAIGARDTLGARGSAPTSDGRALRAVAPLARIPPPRLALPLSDPPTACPRSRTRGPSDKGDAPFSPPLTHHPPYPPPDPANPPNFPPSAAQHPSLRLTHTSTPRQQKPLVALPALASPI